MTKKNMKFLGINMDEAKGDIDEKGFIWPFGYASAPNPQI
jgi:hypothetical protein